MQTDELRFEANGHLIAARASGPEAGLPVLALHGWLDNAATFRALEPALAGVRLLALDLVGHGFSDHRPAEMPYYIWDNLADVVAVADELGWHRFHLLGHSMGASIASLLAGAMPERVASLVMLEGIGPLVDAPAELPEQMAKAIRRRRRHRPTPRFYASIEEAVVARMNGRFPVDAQAARWLVERSIVHTEKGFRWRSDPALTLPSVLRLSEEQVRAFLRRIRCPSLLVLGSRGVVAPLLTRSRTDCVRGLRQLTLEGGHHLHLEQGTSDAVAEAINRFYAAL
jgi:pimeloyl-ACP methyl ester carboxylesterase